MSLSSINQSSLDLVYFCEGISPLWDNSPDYEIKQSNLRHSAMVVSVSSIVCELRNAIIQLVDDIDSLHVGVSHSSLSTRGAPQLGFFYDLLDGNGFDNYLIMKSRQSK